MAQSIRVRIYDAMHETPYDLRFERRQYSEVIDRELRTILVNGKTSGRFFSAQRPGLIPMPFRRVQD